MTDIYTQHSAAFRNVAAYVVTNETGRRVATVAFKFSKSGLRTTCYFHVLGVEMVKAFASGGGYDKCSAAVSSCLDKLAAGTADMESAAKPFIVKDNGADWSRQLRDAGFNVLQAV